MGNAYVDTSCVVAVTFGESTAPALVRRFDEFDALVASNLLEAEVRSVCARERRLPNPALLANLVWSLPNRALTAELERVLDVGHLRGADLWHVATALWISPNPADLTFLTLDARQCAVAAALGFPT